MSISVAGLRLPFSFMAKLAKNLFIFDPALHTYGEFERLYSSADVQTMYRPPRAFCSASSLP